MPSKEELEKLVDKCVKEKGWSREHCRRYIAGGIWGSEFITPTPSDVHVPTASNIVSVKQKQRNQNVFSITAVPIFKAGEWKGNRYTVDDLEEIVRNTMSLIKRNLHEPPIKLGHGEGQELLKNDGLPAGGYVAKIYRVGDEIFADLVDVPKKLSNLIEKRAYSKVSAEIYHKFEHPTTKENIGKVLRAVALLGSDIPAVKGLGDIEKLYHSMPDTQFDYVVFSEQDLSEVNAMTKEWTLKEVETYFPCCIEEVKKFMEEKKLDTIGLDKMAEIVQLKRFEQVQKLMQEEGKPECPPNFTWDEQKGFCVPQGETKDVQEPERKVCPKGYKWDDAEQKCVPIEPAKKEEKPEPKPDEKPKVDEKPSDEKPIEDDGIGEDIADEIYKKKYQDLTPEEKEKVDGVSKRIREKIKKPEVKADEGNPNPEVLKKEPDGWTDDEIKAMNGVYKKDKDAGGTRGQDIADDMKKGGVSEKMQAERPPKAWWDKCVASVSKNPDVSDASALCGWIWYHQMLGSPAKKDETKPDEKPEIKALQEKVRQLENDKMSQVINELKEKNRGILLPKFDEYLNKFSEIFKENDKAVKFGENDFSPLELFYKFLNDFVNSKAVIFKEISKTPKDEKDFSVSDDEKNKIIEKYSELKKGEKVENIELSLLAEKIEKEQNVPYKDALSIAGKILKNGGEK
jgi:hypothetical protein